MEDSDAEIAPLEQRKSLRRFEGSPELWESLRGFFLDHGYDLYQIPQGCDFIGEPRLNTPPAEDSFGYNNDNIPYRSSFVIDGKRTAARDSRNRDVVIKVVAKGESGSNELRILRALNNEPLVSDPRNATLPIFDFLTHLDWHFVVMPMCRPSLRVPLSTIHEILQFAEQVTDALSFLHQNGIAHLDVCEPNIMINYRGDSLVYYPWTHKESLPSWEFRSGFPVRYHLIDFDNAVFSPGFVGQRVNSRYWAEPIASVRPHRAPEVDGPRKFDPFAADVYQTGRMLYAEFSSVLDQIPGFLKILQGMTFKYPPHRVSMCEASLRIHALRGKMDEKDLLQLYDLNDIYLAYEVDVPRTSWRVQVDRFLFWLWKYGLVMC